ncbi:hypothetical protein IFR05_003995 [Cadophora sp. M221]|nr:hypothetical protein IFR05_003995 [Cadophora sp. M221]
MAVELLTFDPDGDLLLRLPYPAEKAKGERTKRGNVGAKTLADDATRDRMEGTMTPEEGAHDLTDESGSPREIQMLVSSKHLMLSSSVFRAMLQHSNFKEGDELRRSGKAEVVLPDDDYVAFGIMMNIIHGRVSKIPRKLSLDIMTKLAILVDKYETLAVFGLVLDVWMPPLTNKIPKFFNKDVLPWLAIAWVFRLPDLFRKMTKLLLTEGDGVIAERLRPDLPIPNWVFDEIEIRRQGAIKSAVGHIETFFSDCRSPVGICDSEIPQVQLACNGIMLGTFLRSASSNNMWPIPEFPYTGLKLAEVTDAILNLTITAVCGNSFENVKYQGRRIRSIQTSESHSVDERLADAMSDIHQSLSGLDLDFLSAP